MRSSMLMLFFRHSGQRRVLSLSECAISHEDPTADAGRLLAQNIHIRLPVLESLVGSK
jgi:hypothetical protein